MKSCRATRTAACGYNVTITLNEIRPNAAAVLAFNGGTVDDVSMNLIASLLSPENVLVGLDASSKKRVFEQAGLMFENHQAIARSTVFDSLFARERLGSTGLGQGVAIPHGRIKGLKEATGAVIRLANPIPFDAPDGKPVSLLFILLVPEQATEQHLQLLSELAQLFSDAQFRERIAAAKDAAAVHALFVTWGAHAPDEPHPAL